MTTPLIILGLLLLPYLAGRVAHRQLGRPRDRDFGAVLGLSIAFAFFGIGHFVQTQAMTEMLPPWIPMRVPLIYLTGLLEWFLAVALLHPRFRSTAGRFCILSLVAFFPANIYAALNGIGMGGHQWGPVYLLIRAPLQAFLIAWTYFFVVKRAKP